jgi:hypothetical protein
MLLHTGIMNATHCPEWRLLSRPIAARTAAQARPSTLHVGPGCEGADPWMQFGFPWLAESFDLAVHSGAIC